ncbi:MAG: hypothetical protein L3J02_07840 [Henriciella sp.]|nr:hypothetical protein [Henriciella sp.]
MKSKTVDYAKPRQAAGIHYSLPKAVFRVELVAAGSEMYLALSEPIYIGDPGATYTMSASSGMLANQNYFIGVEPGTRLLSFVRSESEGQAGNILAAIGEAVGGGGALRSETSEYSIYSVQEHVLYSRIVDPFQSSGCQFGQVCDFGSITHELRLASMAHFQCGTADPDAICGALESNPNFFQIQLNPLFEPLPTQPARKRRRETSATTPCRDSICYRAPLPYAITVRATGYADETNIVLLPNRSPAIPLNIPAGVFANAHAKIALIDGMPVELSVTRENELLAVAKTPLQVINSLFSSFSQVAQLRINYNTERGQLIQSEDALSALRDESDASRAAMASGGSAYSGLTGSRAESAEFLTRESINAQEGPKFGRDDIGQLFKVQLGGSTGHAAPYSSNEGDQDGSGATLQ